jgi:hypothetical protein
VTEVPASVVWQDGAGTSVTCNGPAVAYDTTKPPAAQQSDCTWLFETAGDVTLTATVTYATSWTATDGDAGLLDPVARSATVAVHVTAAQAEIR